MSKEEEKKKSEPEEVSWDSHAQFLLACLAFGVGLGNVWRFPYLVQKYGGGSFIIPFLVMMFVEAMPLLLVELGLGQKFRSGSVGIWNKLHPYFQGIFPNSRYSNKIRNLPSSTLGSKRLRD